MSVILKLEEKFLNLKFDIFKNIEIKYTDILRMTSGVRIKYCATRFEYVHFVFYKTINEPYIYIIRFNIGLNGLNIHIQPNIQR